MKRPAPLAILSPRLTTTMKMRTSYAFYAIGAATFSLVSATLTAQSPVPPRDEQIAAAVLPLPADLRAGAQVLGYDASGKLVTLREGKIMTCLASDPKGTRFHVACYHQSLEPFMARGRSLRAEGVKGEAVDSARFREINAKKLALPNGPAALYSLTGGAFDPKTQTAPEAKRLYVVYIPFATGQSTGLSVRPVGTEPWIMFPGTPKAHVMFTPGM